MGARLMVRRIPLAKLGFKPARAVRRRKSAELTEEQLRARTVERAFQCGARYSHARWVRRAPPRMRFHSYRDPAYELLHQQALAFYRGYDAATIARYAYLASWDMPPDMSQFMVQVASHG